MYRPIRIPFRGPTSSVELVEFAHLVHQLLQQAGEPVTIPRIDDAIPVIDPDITVILGRLHQGAGSRL